MGIINSGNINNEITSKILENDVLVFDYDDTLLSSKRVHYNQRSTYVRDIFTFLVMLIHKYKKIVIIDSHGLNFYNDFINNKFYSQFVQPINDTYINVKKILYIPLRKRPLYGNELQNLECGIKPKNRNSKFDDLTVILHFMGSNITHSSRILFFDDIDWILCNAKYNLTNKYLFFETFKIELKDHPTLMERYGIQTISSYTKYINNKVALKNLNAPNY